MLSRLKGVAKVKKPFLNKDTRLALSICLPMGLIRASISLCVLVICVKKKKLGETEETRYYTIDLNEDYGIYYTSDGDRVEIENEARDYNPYYEATEEQEDAGS